MASTKLKLIDAILYEVERVWGSEGFAGEPGEYEWLQTHCGISEGEDVQWQLILRYEVGDLPDEDLADDQVMRFLEDNFAVVIFLEEFLRKYRSGKHVYPRSR